MTRFLYDNASDYAGIVMEGDSHYPDLVSQLILIQSLAFSDSAESGLDPTLKHQRNEVYDEASELLRFIGRTTDEEALKGLLVRLSDLLYSFLKERTEVREGNFVPRSHH